MCKFFSFISNRGHIHYFDNEIRQKIIKGELNYELDSHSSIADYFGVNEDKFNKYEYSPLTKEFTVDQINGKDDSDYMRKWVEKLDFSKIVPELVLKPIVHPFNDIQKKSVTKKDVELLKQWVSVKDSVRDSVKDSVKASVWDSVKASVWDSVWDSIKDSVRDSVWDSIKDSVRDSVKDSVKASVWDSVWDSVKDSVRDSVWDSVKDSVRDSVRDSVWAYVSSFFNIKKWIDVKHEYGVNPYQCCINLWESGLVPSYDGKYWYLHGRKDARILWKGKIYKNGKVERIK